MADASTKRRPPWISRVRPEFKWLLGQDDIRDGLSWRLAGRGGRIGPVLRDERQD